MPKDLLRSLPSIERLLTRPTASRLSAQAGRDRVRDLLREITEAVRRTAGDGELASDKTEESLTDLIERQLEARIAQEGQPSLRRVINATGVILHTNLGRAPLARAAIEAISEVGASYSNLEYDLARGERGRREAHCQALLARLTGAESAIVVNNNAAAVMLVLNTLAEGGEVIVSRGELIEIGGSFRIPDVMEKSGARLVEVGTTNRTRITDYERAINERTRCILRVHPSNYRIIGFTERPSLEEFARLSDRYSIPTYEDLGSGCLIDLSPLGIKEEPVVAASLEAGVSVVSFSGDKLFGGPQAGVIAGLRDIVSRVSRNPLMRAFRVDKLTYAAIEATLRLYERGVAQTEVPVISAITATRDQILSRAQRFCETLSGKASGLKTSIEEGESVIGGGSAPEANLPTSLVAIECAELSARALEEKLRANAIPIITRTEHDRVLIDLRTVSPEDEAVILNALTGLAQPTPGIAASVEK